MSGKIVILTGAGLSAESGLGTFRDAGGLWEKYRLEDVATPEAFARDPATVQAFYNARRQQAAKAEPNAAHKALARYGLGHHRRRVSRYVQLLCLCDNKLARAIWCSDFAR